MEEITSAPSVDEITEYLSNMKFRRKLFGGYRKESVLENISKVSDMYRAVIVELTDSLNTANAGNKELEARLLKLTESNEAMNTVLQRQSDEVQTEKSKYRQKYDEVLKALDAVESTKKAIEEQAKRKADAYILDAKQKVMNETMTLRDLERKKYRAEEEYNRRMDEIERLNQEYKRRITDVLKLFDASEPESEKRSFFAVGGGSESAG